MGIFDTEYKFIEKAKSKHGETYDYSKVIYVRSSCKVIIICKEHGEFLQTPNKHIYGRGCPKCAIRKNSNKRLLGLENFITKSKQKHGDRYDYSTVNYVNNSVHVDIICKLHGVFKQLPAVHLIGCGCPTCGKYKSLKFHTRNLRVQEKINTINNKVKVVEIENKKFLKDSQVLLECKEHGRYYKKASDCVRVPCNLCSKKTHRTRRRIPIELERDARNLRRRVKKYISNKGYSKTASITAILGIDWEGLKTHLENNPYNFKVGEKDLNLDHIIPLKSAQSYEELLKLNHYTNLQLLPDYYNKFIKSDKIFNRQDLENWLILNNFRGQFN